MKILLIDNYDSYTYNLYQLIAEVSGFEPIVMKNDELSWEELLQLSFDAVVISPGPGSPEKEKDFGICKRVIKEIEKPILGVCLGHQGIYHIFGGEVGLAPRPMHGRRSKIYHKNTGIFFGLPQGFEVVRYHSLLGQGEVPKELSVDARTEDGLIMAISHKTKPIYGVQFHPESICTEYGKEMIENFLRLSETHEKQQAFMKYEWEQTKLQGWDIFERLSSHYGTVYYLDSSKVEEGVSRFSIFGLSSEKHGYILKYDIVEKKVKKILKNGTEEIFEGSIFDYFKKTQEYWKAIPELPFDFQLGYIGYFAYEMKQDSLGPNKHHWEYPTAAFAYVDRTLVLDHQEKTLYLLAYGDDENFFAEVRRILSNSLWKDEEMKARGQYPKVRLLQKKSSYLENIRKSQEYILHGETYEVCLTNRLEIQDKIEAKEYYKILREISPAPYAAFLPFGEISIASSSMEKFLTIHRDGRVQTKPIKGTIQRGKTKEEDEKYRIFLQEDEKNRAENLMIVDLLRNDLGQVCEIGTVRVPKLMDVEEYSTLYQLVSTVEGKIQKNVDRMDVIRACFPGGSMTGAPKKRTVEILDELEEAPRGVYSGCLGYLSNNGCVDLSIVIRTAIISNEKTTMGIGGAITALSSPEEEFEEILLKARGVLKAFQYYYKENTEEEIIIEGSE